MKRVILKIVIAFSILLIAVGVYINYNKPPLKEFTVSFQTNGDNYIDPIKVKEGFTVRMPNTPIKSGYTFRAWQLDGNDYDFNDKIKKDITLTADWVPVDNNVS